MRNLHTLYSAVVMLALAPACGGDGSSTPDPEDCSAPAFVEINDTNASAQLAAEAHSALTYLCENATDLDLALHTYRSIVDGRVQIDTISDLTDLDYATALVFFELPPDTPRAVAMPQLEAELAGYMWGNRIYVVLGGDAMALATTLVHEVNHVLNRSDENYYLPINSSLTPAEERDRLNALTVDEGAAFREEYRAFYIEQALTGASLDVGKEQSMAELKASIAELYGFTSLNLDDFPDFPAGLLVPDESSWDSRPISICSPDLTYFPCE
jgi:hypothetical protein